LPPGPQLLDDPLELFDAPLLGLDGAVEHEDLLS
jgi:hypothetical protein